MTLASKFVSSRGKHKVQWYYRRTRGIQLGVHEGPVQKNYRSGVQLTLITLSTKRIKSLVSHYISWQIS